MFSARHLAAPWQRENEGVLSTSETWRVLERERGHRLYRVNGENKMGTTGTTGTTVRCTSRRLALSTTSRTYSKVSDHAQGQRGQPPPAEPGIRRA